MLLRITTGKAKNKKIKAPNVPDFRAVQEIAKESVFSIIGTNIQNSVCLDLFAGSGNMGLEALSRGAAKCIFVDNNKNSIKTIEENVRSCGFEEKSEIVLAEAVKFAGNTQDKFNYIFVDPFYKDMSHVFLMKNLGEILKKGGLIVFFHGKDLDTQRLVAETNLKIMDSRRFGQSHITFFCSRT